jgi:hypothetical protein
MRGRKGVATALSCDLPSKYPLEEAWGAEMVEMSLYEVDEFFAGGICG